VSAAKNGVTVNTKGGGDGLAVVLGIVAVGAIVGIVGMVITFITMVLIGIGTIVFTGFGYKIYQLHVHKTIALASIAARMPPPPMPGRTSQIPSFPELMLGRNHVIPGEPVQ
jgi:hypothetical protein